MIIRRALAASPAVLLALALAGCSNDMKKTFGLEANPPDAFQVGTQPPLSLPPELGQLPTPNPGQAPTQQVDASAQGQAVLAPQSGIPSQAAPATPADQAFLDQAGPAPQGDIRAEVNQNAAVASRPPGFVSKLMNGGPQQDPTVDAAAEQQRLQENAAMGQPVTNGSTPQDSNQQKGLFDRLFGWL